MSYVFRIESGAEADGAQCRPPASSSQKVQVFVDEGLAEFRDAAFAAIAELVRIAGWQSECCQVAGKADLRYTERSDVFAFAGVSGWRQIATATPVDVDGEVFPDAAVTRPDGLDVVLAAHFFLCGLYERDPQCLENNGVPGTGALKWGIDRGPSVNRIALELRRTLAAMPGLESPRPLWPEGKTWALALTHDCDRVFLYRFKSFLTDSWRALKAGRLLLSAECLLKAAYSAVVGPFRTDPYFQSWRRWMEFEREIGIRSAFYIGTWNRSDPQSHMTATVSDLGYDYRDPRLQKLTRELSAGGWEIGLHSGTQAWMHEGQYAREAERFASGYGVFPSGQRGHYWCLNPLKPHDAFPKIKNAGILYDSSLGMNRLHGYRRGVAYPFKPYDPSTGTWSGLWELPPVIMDDALHRAGRNASERMDAFRKRVAESKEASGLLVLDWHEYTLADGIMDDLGKQFCEELTDISRDSSCWIAKPHQVYEWCAIDRWQH